jgi:hypothetical protein
MKDSTRRWLKRWVIGDLSLRRFAGSIVFIYGSLCALTFLLEDRLLYRPHHPASYADSPEIHKLRSGRFQISARYIEQPGARYTLLYSHGNAEDLEDISVLLDPLHTLGVSVLAYDYAGYGTSEGAPSERQLYEDIDAAYRWLVEKRGVAPGKIVLYGRSLGSGPSVDLATRKPIGGLILESAFTSVFRVATRVSLLPWDHFTNLDKMPLVRCPVLVMHGTDDRLIPIHHGRALHDAAPPRKQSLWVEGSEHGDLPLVAGDRFLASVRAFLDGLDASR